MNKQTTHSRNNNKTVFVTVGSTKFEQLINKMLENDILDLLIKYNFTKLILQIGNGIHNETLNFKFNDLNNNETKLVNYQNQIDIVIYRYKSSLFDDINNSNLVISHAGAGSIIESLEANKKLIVVINENLMDNHQLELGEKMYKQGYLLFTTCSKLNDNIDLIMNNNNKLEHYIKGNPKLFGNYIEKMFN
jgi:UDP-N-acetylglucosamine transferase subunit ALG13